MRCPKCNAEMEDGREVCSRCGCEAAPEVKVLRPEERDGFQGLTLRQDGTEEDRSRYREDRSGDYEYRNEGPGHRVYVRQVSFGSGSSGWLTKLLMAAIVLFLLFVALPAALILMAVFSLFWWLFRR